MTHTNERSSRRKAGAIDAVKTGPREPGELTRRRFLGLGMLSAGAMASWPLAVGADPLTPELARAVETLEPYFTPPGQFRDVSRGKPLAWPLRLTKVHWAALWPGLPAGQYGLRCRSIDAQGNAQPMSRPFEKSGHSALELVEITVAS